MQRSTERILTTHCGSLARPADLLDLMKAKVNGQPYDPDAYARRVRSAVAETVRQQIESGIDVVTDGEQGKPGFFTYVSERLSGFAPKPDARFTIFADEVAAFPEYYKEYFSQAMLGGSITLMFAPPMEKIRLGTAKTKGLDKHHLVRSCGAGLWLALHNAGGTPAPQYKNDQLMSARRLRTTLWHQETR